jgi:hypothetical protein
MVCDRLGLIGKEMFSIDGCKLPSNASKEWSGTKADLKMKSEKIERAVGNMLKKHREEDKKGARDDSMRQREEKQIATLRKASHKIQKFLNENEDRQGISGKVVQSNITDNASAKMKTTHGVLQHLGSSSVSLAAKRGEKILRADPAMLKQVMAKIEK